MHRKVRHAAAALQYPKVGIFTPSLSRYILYMVAAARNQVDKFANPEHRRCAYYDEQPVGHAEGHDAEKRPSTLHYGDLPKMIISAMSRNPWHPLKWKAERPLANDRALKRFQNCRNTNMEKNRLSS